jgi:hypothetical protein
MLHNAGMLKRNAIRMLIGATADHQVIKEGTDSYVHGVFSKAARVLQVTPQAVKDWPELLPRRIEDRVIAALCRRYVEAARGAPLEEALAGLADVLTLHV